MTDEEQQKLCADLRQIYRYIDNDEINELIWQAAKEIERLADELFQTRVRLDRLEKEGWRIEYD